MDVAVELLRPGLLDGLGIVVAGAAGEDSAPDRQTICKDLDSLGAGVRSLRCDAAAIDEAATDAAVASLAEQLGGIDTLVVDGAELFAAYGLQPCLAGAWDVTRAVVNGAFLRTDDDDGERATVGGGGGGSAGVGGRIVYLAPAPSASPGEHADAARAGLENLARTLSIEWARHRITTVAIALGDSTTPGEAAAIVAYLASPAGAYFSGCQLDLRGPAAPPSP